MSAEKCVECGKPARNFGYCVDCWHAYVDVEDDGRDVEREIQELEDEGMN